MWQIKLVMLQWVKANIYAFNKLDYLQPEPLLLRVFFYANNLLYKMIIGITENENIIIIYYIKLSSR